MSDPSELLEPVLRVQAAIRDAGVAACEAPGGELARIEREAEGDTIYAIDRVSEERLVDLFKRHVAVVGPLVLVAEGLDPGGVVLPRGTPAAAARWRALVDPIDGTRGLMYQKRSAWILTGVAPNLAGGGTLRDVVLAAQTEIPLVKQHLSDRLWAICGQAARAERYDRLTGALHPLRLRPSSASSRTIGRMRLNRIRTATPVSTIQSREREEEESEPVAGIDAGTEREQPEIRDAKIIVAGGHGIRNKAEFDGLLQPLADGLEHLLGDGAKVAASRMAVEDGFTTHDFQVGQTGQTVQPRLYVAIGISGAVQHITGMQGSEIVVAINKDPKARIFNYADFGVVGDSETVVPELIRATEGAARAPRSTS